MLCVVTNDHMLQARVIRMHIHLRYVYQLAYRPVIVKSFYNSIVLPFGK